MRPGLAGYDNSLGRGGFDSAHAATPQALGTWRMPVQFRRVSGADVLVQSAFEIPLRRPAPNPGTPIPPVAAAQHQAAFYGHLGW